MRSVLVLGAELVREVAGVCERGVEAVPEAPVVSKRVSVCEVGGRAEEGVVEPTRGRVAAGTAVAAAAGRLGSGAAGARAVVRGRCGSTGAAELQVIGGRPRMRRACLAFARSEVALVQHLDSW